MPPMTWPHAYLQVSIYQCPFLAETCFKRNCYTIFGGNRLTCRKSEVAPEVHPRHTTQAFVSSSKGLPWKALPGRGYHPGGEHSCRGHGDHGPDGHAYCQKGLRGQTQNYPLALCCSVLTVPVPPRPGPLLCSSLSLNALPPYPNAQSSVRVLLKEPLLQEVLPEAPKAQYHLLQVALHGPPGSESLPALQVPVSQAQIFPQAPHTLATAPGLASKLGLSPGSVLPCIGWVGRGGGGGCLPAPPARATRLRSGHSRGTGPRTGPWRG